MDETPSKRDLQRQLDDINGLYRAGTISHVAWLDMCRALSAKGEELYGMKLTGIPEADQ